LAVVFIEAMVYEGVKREKQVRLWTFRPPLVLKDSDNSGKPFLILQRYGRV
jgi:hypothetical protein